MFSVKHTVCGWRLQSSLLIRACVSPLMVLLVPCAVGQRGEQTAWLAGRTVRRAGSLAALPAEEVPSVLGLQRVFIRNRCGIC